MPKLFETFPQHREEIAIWKLMHTMDFWDYANGIPVKWVAVNIPINVFGKNGFKEDGDIDLMFSLAAPPFLNGLHDYVRAFEVKTSTIDAGGNIKSFDNEKFEHGFKQCEKLERFGAEMIFYLEYIILQSGKIVYKPETWEKVRNKIAERRSIFEKSNYGYVVKYKQYLPDSDEYSSGTYVPTDNEVHAKFLTKGNTYQDLTSKLDKIAYSQNVKGVRVLFYCKNCRQVAVANSVDRNHVCNHCGCIINVHD